MDQGCDFPVNSGGGFRHCNRQRCLVRGEPGASADPQAGGRSGARNTSASACRERLALELARRGTESGAASNVFDPNTLTLGLARRFASYKRPTLLLNDTERLIRILTNRERPVQLVVAGKAHPQDEGAFRSASRGSPPRCFS
jgi:hypothetical protein